jgi:tetratricopeptide (TPR) repeat protein
VENENRRRPPRVEDDRLRLVAVLAGISTIAETLRDHGNLSEAELASKAANEVADQLVKNYPSYGLYQHNRARRYVSWGALLQDQGKYDAALSSFRSGEAIMRKLTASDPDNADWKRLSRWR